jgi:hypothetical protein
LLLLLFLLAQKIRVYKFWSYIHRGVATNEARIVASVVHTSRILTTAAEEIILTHHLGAIHMPHVIR